MSHGLATIALSIVGCSVPIAQDLDDGAANEIIAALDTEGIAAAKEPDTRSDGRWQLTVRQGDTARAARLLTTQNLPAPHWAGLRQVTDTNALVPSLQSEQARLLSGLSNDLEQSLLSVPGIVAARVLFPIPTWDPLADANRPNAGASVIVRHRGLRCPLTITDIQRLVSGVANVVPDQVVVVMSPVNESRVAARHWTRVGPIVVSRDSALWLRAMLGLGASLNLTMLALLLYFWRKARRNPAA